jgi:hypothetical protein
MEGTGQMNLPSAQKPLVERISGIDYSIGLARKKAPIGKMLAGGHSLDIFLDDLGKVIYQVVGDLGIKNLPDEISEKRIIHYIVNYFRDLTLEDIRLAFELAIAGELDTTIEHYQSFDLQYICKILKAYRVRLKKANQNLLITRPKAQEKEVSDILKKQYRQDFNNTLFDHYKNYCLTGTVGVMAFSFVFDHFMNEKIFSLTKKKMQKYHAKAIEILKGELTKHSSEVELPNNRRILKNFEIAINGSEKNRLESLTKKAAILDFFNTCKKKKIDFKKLIEKQHDN